MGIRAIAAQKKAPQCGAIKIGRRSPSITFTQNHITLGSLNASISPAKASIGTQLQNTFLSP